MDIPIDIGVRGIRFADVSGDGRPDLITTNRTGSDDSVGLGNGDGTFAPVTNYPVGQEPREVAIGDLNGDGLPDLVTANGASDTLSVRLGVGLGAFGSETTVPCGGGPWYLCLCDWNLDGRLDAATPDSADNTVSIFWEWRRRLSCRAPRTPSAGSRAECCGGDVNGDGVPDILCVCSFGRTLALLLNNGAGNFPTIEQYASDGGPWSLAVGDVDLDGRLDAVTGNRYEHNISVLLNRASATPSVSTFGAGTRGCSGTVTLEANIPPKIGQPGFRLTALNAPSGNLGVCLVGTGTDPAGSDPLFLGALFHVDPILFGLDLYATAVGGARRADPNPQHSVARGAVVCRPGIFLESVGWQCSGSPFHLVSSQGLVFTLF